MPSSSFLFYIQSGPSPSQKKTLFHKIVSKYKHKKEKAGTLDKGETEKACVMCLCFLFFIFFLFHSGFLFACVRDLVGVLVYVNMYLLIDRWLGQLFFLWFIVLSLLCAAE